MNWQGWVFMIIAWGLVTSLSVWCFWKVLTNKREDREKLPPTL